MSSQVYKNKIFIIKEISESLGLVELLKANKLFVTYNQLMKTESALRYIFIFDETGPEIPSLILYCNHFNVSLLKISCAETNEIQKTIKHAKLIGIPVETELPEAFYNRISNATTVDLQIDLLKLKDLKI